MRALHESRHIVVATRPNGSATASSIGRATFAQLVCHSRSVGIDRRITRSDDGARRQTSRFEPTGADDTEDGSAASYYFVRNVVACATNKSAY